MKNNVSFHLKFVVFIAFFYHVNTAFPVVYPTDIVARDLNAPGMGWIGHIGIAIADDMDIEADNVIEVLYEPVAMQINSLAEFKNKTSYWGAKYGVNLNATTGMKMLDEAAFQMSLNCTEYTYTNHYTPGMGEWGMPFICPLFRCDTFVNYIYWRGGFTLPTFKPPGVPSDTMPRAVYNAFPNQRDDELTDYNPEMIQQNSALYHSTINTLSAEQLNQLDFNDFRQIIDKPTLTTAEINTLIPFVQNPDFDMKKKIFILDELGFTASPDSLPKLIGLYATNPQNDEFRHMIIRDTQAVYQRNPMDNYPAEKQLLLDFYNKLLDTALPQDIVIASRGIIALSPEHELNQKISKINAVLQHRSITPENRISIKIMLAFKLESSESHYITEIINELEQQNKIELDVMFAGTIAARLANHGRQSLNIDSKAKIAEYLDIMKSRLDNPVKPVWQQSDRIWHECMALIR